MTGQLGMDDTCQFFSHPISNGTPPGFYGPEVGANFMDFGKAIKLLGDYTCWVHFAVS